MSAVEAILGNLSQVATFTLLVVFALILVQEAVNGFHDAANAVATVIYSNSLKPVQAVGLSATMNFLGVLLGGTAVAFSFVFLLPNAMIAGIDTREDAALMLALVTTALAWNLGTWWLGIPNSTTHTYIGAALGVSMAHAGMVGTPIAEGLDLHVAGKVLLTLVVSPIFGFVLAWLLYKLVRALLRDDKLYEPQVEGRVPSKGIRAALIAGSAGVSFLHGSNDGQKSIGLMLMALMGLAPAVYALDPVDDAASYRQTMAVIEPLQAVARAHVEDPGKAAPTYLAALEHMREVADLDLAGQPVSAAERVRFRTEILDLHQALGRLLARPADESRLNAAERATLERAYATMTRFIEHVPFWLILLSATVLGCGTLVGYRRIVTTLGEGLGDRHMSPAQGIAAQFAAMGSIGAADFGGMPVSTTHVMTAGVAATVKASGDRMRWGMVSRIALAWVTTLPGTIVLAFALAHLLHAWLA